MKNCVGEGNRAGNAKRLLLKLGKEASSRGVPLSSSGGRQGADNRIRPLNQIPRGAAAAAAAAPLKHSTTAFRRPDHLGGTPTRDISAPLENRFSSSLSPSLPGNKRIFSSADRGNSTERARPRPPPSAGHHSLSPSWSAGLFLSEGKTVLTPQIRDVTAHKLVPPRRPRRLHESGAVQWGFQVSFFSARLHKSECMRAGLRVRERSSL